MKNGNSDSHKDGKRNQSLCGSVYDPLHFTIEQTSFVCSPGMISGQTGDWLCAGKRLILQGISCAGCEDQAGAQVNF
jgi:hypothetical protein